MFYFIVSRTNISLHNRVVCLGCYLISCENWVTFSVPLTTTEKEWEKVFAQVPFKIIFTVTTLASIKCATEIK